MNENIDLTKILEGCPEGAKLWSPVVGECYFEYIEKTNDEPIILSYRDNTRNYVLRLSSEGKYLSPYASNIEDVDICVFPSKEQRDWAKFERFWDKPKVERFDPKTFQPFDKVLARCTESEWMPTLFGFLIDIDNKDPHSPFINGEKVVCVDIGYHQCIPYNEETRHLVGTLNDCPKYYKWWEEQL